MIVENNNNNSNGHGSDVARKNTPARLTPLQGKTEDTYHTSANISKESDANRSQFFTQADVDETQRLVNPHYLLPPIPRNMNQSNASDRLDYLTLHQSDLSPRTLNPLGMERYLLNTVILPDKQVQLSLSEEAELQRRVAEDLRGLSSQVLKAIYLELTAYDPKLTGYVHFNDLTITLLRNQVNLSVYNQRLLAAMFMSESEPDKVHYEKFLYFLSSSMKKNSELMKSDFTRGQDLKLSRSGFQNPPISDREPASGRGYHDNLSNNSNHVATDTTAPTRKTNKRTEYDTSQLLHVVEEQLKERNTRNLDIDRIWDMFRHADRSCSQVLSREQIKALAFQCRIQLDEDILDQVIDRCYKGNDRYWWEQFLNFIGRFLVHKTGLNIPERSRDFVKPYSRQDFNRAEDDVNRGFASKESRLAAVEKKESELAKLEKIVQMTRQRINEMRRTSTLAEPWLKRFMSMAQAMYDFDENRTGYLTAMEARWLTREYSQGLDLGLTDKAIQMAIRRSTDDDTQAVAIEHLLRTLVSQG